MAGCFTFFVVGFLQTQGEKKEQAMIYVENRKLKLAN